MADLMPKAALAPGEALPGQDAVEAMHHVATGILTRMLFGEEASNPYPNHNPNPNPQSS